MAITTRETTATGVTNKGSPLTNAEVDTNFVELQQNKLELDDLSVGAEADASGDGAVSYDNTTGVFTYTPPADISGAVTFAAQAGEALNKGDAVYVSGLSGNKPVVSKADADDSSKMAAFGLAEADASLNAAVNVVTFGTLYNLDTSAFTAGDTVYVDTTAGGLTATKPSGESSLIQNIGKVIRSHASAGSIKVGGAGRTNDVPNLNDGNVFIGNASNQSEARALTTSDIASGTFANARIAEGNVTQHQAALSITESQISDLQTYLTSSTVRAAVEAATDSNVFTDADHTKLNGIEANATADQTDAEIRAAVEAASDSNVFTDADHSKLDGIEASADVTDTANVTAAGALMDSEVTNLAQVKAFDSSDYATAAQGSTADSALQNVVEDTTPQLGGNLDFNGNTATSFASTGIDDNASSTSLTIASGGDVTIDGTDASASIASPAILNLKAGDADDEYSTLRFATSADGSIGYIGAKATTTGAYPNSVGNLQFGVQNGASTVTAMTITEAGNVGVNTAEPTSKLEVAHTNGDVITIKDTNLTASASNIGNVRVAWDDSAGTRVAYVGSVNSDEFWVNNQYSTVVLTYAGARMFETISGGAKLYGKLNITDSEYDNHLELNRSNEQWRFSPSTNGSLDIRRVSGTGTAVLDILSDTNITGDVAAGASATGGVAAYAINYSGDHLLNVFGALRSSGNTILTYGAKPSPTVNGGYVSAAGNFAFEKTALELSGGGLSVKFSPSGTDAVDSALTMSTMLDVSGSTAVGCTVSIKAGSSGNEGGQLNLDTVSSGTYSIDAYSDNMRFLNGTSSGDIQFYKNGNSAVGVTIFGSGKLQADDYLAATPSSCTARTNGLINYIYNVSGSSTPTRGGYSHHVYQCWSNSPTITLTDSSFTRGDIVEFVNVRGAVTITVNVTRCYLPTGSYDTQLTLSSAGKFRLIKYSTSAGYWMLG